MDLQELITRGRYVFAKAPERLEVFEQVNGRRNTFQIARLLKRHVNNVRRDLQFIADAGLIQPKADKNGRPLKVNGFPVYEKVPLAKTISGAYFRGPARLVPLRETQVREAKSKVRPKRPKPVPLPTETEILDISRSGEDQIYEFKSAGTEVRKISKEIAAMLNTKRGGIIFYGIEDDGTIQGSDMNRQRLDQPLQNSIKNSISPAATVTLKSVSVMGSAILVIIVPPWNRRDVYQFDERVLIRKSTNVFAAKPEELRKLHRGEYVV